MPLVRFEVRSEYGLGQPELYRDADSEDPKEVLHGVSVAGLVGILRQLGDLAEFAAEVFHGIQEEVMTTASRSHKMMTRVQRIEAAVPSLEKAVLAQASHIHFAYTAGRVWHPCIQNEQNHFIYNDLPRFIMDSYEECWDPPRLHLLDKFDTGGPGSCLKRYSDPTYFRRAPGSPVEANNEIQRDKKSRKIKKKRSSKRNRDVSSLASMSNQSSRGRFTSLSFSGRTSSFQTASTVEMAFKYDLQDHCNSFDSRSGSGYTESLSNLNSSVKYEERKSKKSSSSRLTQHADTIGSVHSDSRSETVDDHFPYCVSHKQAARGSSCFSWDEKAEKIEHNGQQCVQDEASQMIENDSVLYAPNVGRFDTREPVLSLNQMNEVDRGPEIENQLEIESDLEIENEPKLESEPEIEGELEIQSEPEMESELEIESEGDNYVDASNTIESESENDIECQTKREVDQHSSNVRGEIPEDAAYEPMPHNTDYDQSIHVASDTNERISCSLLDHVPSENVSDEQIPHASGRSSDFNCSPVNDVCADDHNGSKGESVIRLSSLSNPSPCIFENPLCNNGIQEPQESLAETSHGGQSVKIWTNGSLLGLEPSKPPVFAVPNSVNLGTKTEDGVNVPSIARKERSDKLFENSQQLHNIPSSSSEEALLPFTNPDSSHVKSGNSQQTDGIVHVNGLVLTNTSMVTPRDVHTGVHQGRNETSSRVFGFSHRLLMNGFLRKESLTHDTKSVPTSIPETTEVTEQSRLYGQAIQETTFTDPFGLETPFDWLTLSPPLKHMKISFNPAEGFHSCKLKLKLPDRVQCHGSNRNSFPSFQLVPEPAIFLTGTDSDDDTFCRSSPYMSGDDDYLSDNHSGSNFDQWEESSQSPERKDQELYDALQSSMHVENSDEPSLSGPLLDVPSFDALKPSLHIEAEDNSVSKNLLTPQNPMEHTPPPLPPVQWRVSKTSSERFENKQQTLQDVLTRAFSEKFSLSSGSEQSHVALLNKEQPNWLPAAPKPENKVHQKFNVEEESNQSANGEDTDKGDFLHQIRTKQFTLRRTVTMKPSAGSGPTTNVNINAILEKANAIRQAVASDGGDETDTWSDA